MSSVKKDSQKSNLVLRLGRFSATGGPFQGSEIGVRGRKGLRGKPNQFLWKSGTRERDINTNAVENGENMKYIGVCLKKQRTNTCKHKKVGTGRSGWKGEKVVTILEGNTSSGEQA